MKAKPTQFRPFDVTNSDKHSAVLENETDLLEIETDLLKIETDLPEIKTSIWKSRV